jgi:hypothetical protein
MNNRFLVVGILLACMIISGFILSRTGRPFNGWILAVHKLISLGTLIYLIIIVTRANRAVPLRPETVVLAVAAAAFFLALFASGGVISGMKTPPGFVTLIHHIAPYVLAALTLGVLYLV